MIPDHSWSNGRYTVKMSMETDDSYSSAKLKKITLVMSLKDTPVTQSILCLIFLMYVRIIQCLYYGGQESKIFVFWQGEVLLLTD